MSKRPSLTLKFSAAPVPKQESQDSPPLATPSSATGLKLKFGKKTTPQTAAPQPSGDGAAPAPKSSAKAKPGRKPKPTPKKRALEEDVDPPTSEDEEASALRSTSGPKIKKIRLFSHGATQVQAHTGPTILRTKVKGQAPKRPRGVGYDSEADDREEDPMISESIILRMKPGPDCDYLRAAITAGNFGKTDIRMRFFREDGRRALITIRGSHYAAILVDLPCVIEGMKSWFPKTGWMKSVDICQMLMVLGQIKQKDLDKVDEEAMNYPLPLGKGELDEKTWQWAHGLTPPMHWVRKRRFRKTISVRTVTEVEAEVEELLRKDELCEGEPKIEIIDRVDRGSEAPSDDISSEDEDAEGDIDEQDQQAETPLETIEGDEDEEAENARMAELFERQMMAGNDENEPDTSHPLTSAGPSFDSPAALETVSTPASYPATPSGAATPAAAVVDTSSAAEEDDESDEDEEDGEEPDEDQMERQQELQKLKEEVEDLEAAIKGEQAKLAGTQNALLRKRLADKIRGLQGDLELKVKATGGGEG